MSTILVIDDDAQVQKFLRTVLEQEGYAVRCADNGMRGVRQYRREPANLVLCDIFMERQDGLETIRQLRQEFPQVKIIAISGGSRLVAGDFLEQAKMFGALATLQKPLAAQILLETVRNVLQE
jgi:CheY-like chemotaxis protein